MMTSPYQEAISHETEKNIPLVAQYQCVKIDPQMAAQE